MSTSTADFPDPRVQASALNAFGGILRLSSRQFFGLTRWLVLAGVLALFAFVTKSSIRPGDIEAFHAWVANFHLGVLVPLFAFIFGAGAIRDDLKPETVDYVFTRPVRRPVYLLLRFAAHTIWAQVDFLLALGVLVAVGAARGIPGATAMIAPLLLAQIATIVAFGAFGFLCGLVTTRYMIVGLVYGTIVEVGVGNIPTELSRISITHNIRTLLEPMLAGGPGRGPDEQGAYSTIAFLTLFTAVLLAAAAAIFSLREHMGSRKGDT